MDLCKRRLLARRFIGFNWSDLSVRRKFRDSTGRGTLPIKRPRPELIMSPAMSAAGPHLHYNKKCNFLRALSYGSAPAWPALHRVYWSRSGITVRSKLLAQSM